MITENLVADGGGIGRLDRLARGIGYIDEARVAGQDVTDGPLRLSSTIMHSTKSAIQGFSWNPPFGGGVQD
jgi:hypothetical protein